MLGNSTFIVIGIIATIIFFFVYLVFTYEKKRAKALQEKAGNLGFQFESKVDDGIMDKYENFNLSLLGNSNKIINFMRGKQNDNTISIFEHLYSTPSEEGTSEIRHTVIAIEHKTELPSFLLFPNKDQLNVGKLLGSELGGFIEEKLGYRSGKVSGFSEIKINLGSTFSDNYILKGKNSSDIETVFNTDVINFLESNEDLYIENQKNILLCYYKSIRYKASELDELIDTAAQIQKLLARDSLNLEL